MSSSMILMLWHLREMASKVRQICRELCIDMMGCMCRPIGTHFVWNSATRDSAAGLQRSCGSSDADGISEDLHSPVLSLCSWRLLVVG